MNGLTIKGINYDAGIKFSPNNGTRISLNSSIMMKEISLIKHELHCNAVRIYGDNLDKLIECAKIALKEELNVWFSPRSINANQQETLEFIRACSKEVEKLRKDYSNLVFVIGTELSLDVKGFIKGQYYI
jgi:hypothetical protein